MIESTESGTMISGAHAAQGTYFYMSLVGRLAMQHRGTRFRGVSPLAQAQAYCGTPKRTARGALEDYVIWLHQNGMPIRAMWGTVEGVLGPDRTAKLRRKAEKISK
jgi:hypothetical protein